MRGADGQALRPAGRDHGALAAEFDGVHADNYRHPLAADVSVFASDRIHANGCGHAVAAANLLGALITLLSGGCTGPGSWLTAPTDDVRACRWRPRSWLGRP